MKFLTTAQEVEQEGERIYLRRRVEFMEREIEAGERRYDALLDKYVLLANPPVIHNTPHANEEKPVVSVITQAIRDESGGDQRLAAFLRKRSRDLKAEHPDWEDEQVAAELAKWETTEEVGQ